MTALITSSTISDRTDTSQGAAFRDITGAVAERGLVIRPQGPGKALFQCPNPGHFRARDLGHGVSIEEVPGTVKMHCYGGCNNEDILAAIDRELPHMYDEPKRKRPTRNEAEHAIDAARGFTVHERHVLARLLRRADYRTCFLPSRWQPPAQRDWAKQLGMARSGLERYLEHLAHHRWVSRTCVMTNCQRSGTHGGKGHRTFYQFDIGENCAGASCAMNSQRVKRTVPGSITEDLKGPLGAVKRTLENRVPAGQVPVFTDDPSGDETQPTEATVARAAEPGIEEAENTERSVLAVPEGFIPGKHQCICSVCNGPVVANSKLRPKTHSRKDTGEPKCPGWQYPASRLLDPPAEVA